MILQIGEIGGEEILCLCAVWAVRLGEYDDFVAGDGVLDGLFSGHGCSGRWSCDAGKESPDGPVIYTVEHEKLSEPVRADL